MPYYYVNVNAQPQTGDHEVHTTGCPKPPLPENRHGLGEYPNCQAAVRAAKTIYPTADGCAYCLPACHKS